MLLVLGSDDDVRDLLGHEALIVIEKILAVDEALEPTLPTKARPATTCCAR